MLRITNSLIYQGVSNVLREQQNKLAITQEKISSGRNYLKPSDAPDQMAAIDRLESRLRHTNQYMDNLQNANNLLQEQEVGINAIEEGIRRVYELTLQANNDTLSDDMKEILSLEVEQIYEGILQTANTVNQYGEYLYSGNVQNEKPFKLNADGSVSYTGSDDVKEFIVDNNVRMEAGLPGSALFSRIFIQDKSQLDAETGTIQGQLLGDSDTYTAESEAITINGVSIGAVGDPDTGKASAIEYANAINAITAETNVTASAKSEYILSLKSDGAGETLRTDAAGTAAGEFTINGTKIIYAQGADASDVITAINTAMSAFGVSASATADGNISISSNTGQDLVLDGANFNGGNEVTTKGYLVLNHKEDGWINVNSLAPTEKARDAVVAKAGLTVSDGSMKPVSMFKILQNAISGMRTGDKSVLQESITHLNAINDHMAIQKVRLGTHMQAVANQTNVLSLRADAFEESISKVEDLDYVQAVTDLKNQSLALQAGQQSFAQISSLSLFNYIK